MTEKLNHLNAAVIIIGNEILSGRTKDINSNYLSLELGKVGIAVNEIRVVPDDKDEIVEAVNYLRKKFYYVFTSGGIGPTHDDITAECIADAFKVPLVINKEAKRLLASHYPGGKKDLNEARLRMARIPIGASLIENSISKAPGFQIENVFVLAGVPKIFKVMVKFVLNQLDTSKAIISETVTIYKPEGEIAGKLAHIAGLFPNCSIGSYPFEAKGTFGTNVVVADRDRKIIKEVCTLIANL